MGTRECTSQITYQSVQRFLQGSRSWQTDRQTDRPWYSVCNNRPRLLSTAMRHNNTVLRSELQCSLHRFIQIKCRFHRVSTCSLPRKLVYWPYYLIIQRWNYTGCNCNATWQTSLHDGRLHVTHKYRSFLTHDVSAGSWRRNGFWF